MIHSTPEAGVLHHRRGPGELRAGRMIVLVDDEHRENEGDLVMAGEAMTPATVNFMIRQACGRLCVAMSRSNADRLGLDLLPGVNLDPTATHSHTISTLATAFRQAFRHSIAAGRYRFVPTQSSGPHDLVRDKGPHGWSDRSAGRRPGSRGPYP